ncbi:MAG: hypothetical protein FWF10_05990 [Clostridiales bacterium]|nr:hypothetical protein [Clostridiales bacterium]
MKSIKIIICMLVVALLITACTAQTPKDTEPPATDAPTAPLLTDEPTASADTYSPLYFANELELFAAIYAVNAKKMKQTALLPSSP